MHKCTVMDFINKNPAQLEKYDDVKHIMQTESNTAATDKETLWGSLFGNALYCGLVLKALYECVGALSAQ